METNNEMSEALATPAVKMVNKKGDMTKTAEKLYAEYEKARALFRAAEKYNEELEGKSQKQIEQLENYASDSKKDD